MEKRRGGPPPFVEKERDHPIPSRAKIKEEKISYVTRIIFREAIRTLKKRGSFRRVGKKMLLLRGRCMIRVRSKEGKKKYIARKGGEGGKYSLIGKKKPFP